MSSLEQTLVKIAQFLKAEHIPYLVIGGVANLFWGVARTTLDIDITIQVQEKDIVSFIDQVGRAFRLRVGEPRAFIDKTNVLPVEDSNGVRIDLIFARLNYEIKAIQRAKDVRVGDTNVQICTPEDLIIHKIISDRPRDQEDVRGVIQRLGGRLNRGYLDSMVKELSEALAQPDMWQFYLSCFEGKLK